MSKRNHVCFKCRIAIRREEPTTKPAKCPTCGNECVNIGYKIPVPKKSKKKEWDKLESQVLSQGMKGLDTETINITKRKHELEKELAEMKSRPQNKGRKALIKQLENELHIINANNTQNV